MSAGAELSDAEWKRREGILREARKPFKIISVSVGDKIFFVEETALLDRPFASLTVFTRPGAGAGRNFLVVPPLAGAFPVLLRDLVIALLRHADRVAVADWLDPRFVPLDAGRFGFSENVLNLVEMIRACGPDAHVVAVCQAASPALAATALLAADEPGAAPRSLTLIGGPIDPAANPSGVAQALGSRSLSWIRANLIEPAPPGFPGSGRRVYSKERQFRSFLAYLEGHLRRQGELFWKLLFDEGEAPLRFPFWTLISTLMDLTEEFVLEDVQAVFYERALARGALIVDGRRVDPRAIVTTAVMAIEGGADELAAPGQTRAALDLVGHAAAERRRLVLIENCGHFSLFHGRTCRQKVVPAIVNLVDSVNRRPL